MKSVPLVVLGLVALVASQSTKSNSNKGNQQGGRLLALPEPELCAARQKQWNFRGHNYFFSADQPEFREFNRKTGQNEPVKVDWLDARNRCRERCMDAVSMETEAENNMVFEFMQRNNVTYIWTSGRLCDFDGCDRADLQPTKVFGWFWSGTNTKMAPTNSTPTGWSYQPWSSTGHEKRPQPDNAEFRINRTPESCMGVLQNIYNDGIKWHDIGCYHKKPFICEDSDELLRYIKHNNQELVL